MRKYEKGNQVYRVQADSDFEAHLIAKGFEEVGGSQDEPDESPDGDEPDESESRKRGRRGATE